MVSVGESHPAAFQRAARAHPAHIPHIQPDIEGVRPSWNFYVPYPHTYYTGVIFHRTATATTAPRLDSAKAVFIKIVADVTS